MEPLALILPIGPVVALGFYYLRNIVEGGHGAGRWAWAWAALWISGALHAVGTTASVAVANACGAMFMAFMLAGAIEFRGGVLPRWLLPACGCFGLLRALLTLAGARDLSYVLAAPYEIALGAAAFREVRRAPEEVRSLPSHLLLGPALFALAALDGIDVVIRALAGPADRLVPIWIAGAYATVLVQIVAVVDRLRLREQRGHAEREHLAAAVEAERRTLRSVLDTAPVGIVLVDRDWRVRMVNRLGTQHLGLGAPEAWLGRTAGEMAARYTDRLRDRQPFEEAVRAVLRDPLVVLPTMEVSFLPPDDRVLVLFSSPVASDDGELIGRVLTSRDVTAERRLETELRQAQKMETLGTLAGGIAHDFNNQLTAILGNCRFALDGLPADHESADALTDLQRAAEHCADLTRSLLAFARRAPADPHASDVGRAVEAAARLLRTTLPRSVRLELDVAPALLAVADAGQLQQVLVNLGVNARDAVGDAGTIRIGARARAVAPEEGRALGVAAGDYVELTMRDDGAGMDSATLARAFDPFFTTKPVGAGTGLGLAVVYGVVRAHGGWIGAESEPGRGATFRMLIPAAEKPPEPAPAVADAAPPAARRIVLLAEDEPAVRRVAHATLVRAGYRVLEAGDGAEAIRLLEERGHEIDLAVLDISMPRLDGIAALDAMRRLRPSLRALLVSGRIPPGLERRPGVEFLAKPFEPDELTERVRRLLGDGANEPTSSPAGGVG